MFCGALLGIAVPDAILSGLKSHYIVWATKSISVSQFTGSHLHEEYKGNVSGIS